MRVFTKVPPGRPQNENDRITLHQQAKEAGVDLVYPNAFPGQCFFPFSPPQEGPVLLGLVSEQPVPLLASLLAHRPKRAYLASTQDLETRLGRMRAVQGVFAELGTEVEVATVSGPEAMSEVKALFRPVVTEAVARGLPVVANHLNGGTKLMALGLLQALHPNVAVEYLRGSHLLRLDQGLELPVPWNKVGARRVLRLFGYRLQPHQVWKGARYHRQVLALAERLLQVPEDASRSQEFLNAWQRAFGALPARLEPGQVLGLALEYVVYIHLKGFLQKEGGSVAPPGHLVPEEPMHNPREVDGIFWWKGSLGFVECKPTLGTALTRHHEDAALWLLQERFGGIFGKGILVVRKGSWRPHERPPSVLPSVLANRNLRVFSLEGRQELTGGTIFAFPQDLPEAFRNFG